MPSIKPLVARSVVLHVADVRCSEPLGVNGQIVGRVRRFPQRRNAAVVLDELRSSLAYFLPRIWSEITPREEYPDGSCSRRTL